MYDVFGIFEGVKFSNSGFAVQLVLDDTKLTVGFGVMCIVGDGLSVEPRNTMDKSNTFFLTMNASEFAADNENTYSVGAKNNDSRCRSA